MEQQLINSLVRLLAKSGADSLIRDFVRQIDENGDPATWTPPEVEKAISYISWQADNFGTAEASAIVESLIKRYHLNAQNFASDHALPETTGVKGLQ